MKRRAFLTLVGGVAAAWPLAAGAQQASECGASVCSWAGAQDRSGRTGPPCSVLARGLQEFGWTVGRNMRIDARWTAANPDDIRKHAAEFVALPPDVILAAGSVDLGSVATGDAHRSDRVRACPRSGRRRLR